MTAQAIEIIVNGETRRVRPGQTVIDLLREICLEPSRLAVEMDRRILKQTEWNSTKLQAGAVIEIVQFVGGG